MLVYQGNQRLVDDLERRINPLFDALNCDSLSKPVVDQLLVLTEGVISFFIMLICFLTHRPWE